MEYASEVHDNVEPIQGVINKSFELGVKVFLFLFVFALLNSCLA